MTTPETSRQTLRVASPDKSVRVRAALDLVADDRYDLAHAQREYERCRGGLHVSVRCARDAGATWEQIGDEFGISKQAAQQPFAKLVEDLFLADDLQARGFPSVAEWIRDAPDHEAVEEIRAGVLRLVSDDQDDHR